MKTTKIKLILIDMDGVVADFVKYFEEETGVPISYYEGVEEKRDEFKALKKTLIVEKNMFEALEPMVDATILLEGLEEIAKEYKNVSLKFMTAVGDYDTETSARQKRNWVLKHAPDIEFDYCVKSHEKAEHADETTVLIDDRKKCIIPFEEAGGIGVLHINAKDTLRQIRKVLDEN